MTPFSFWTPISRGRHVSKKSYILEISTGYYVFLCKTYSPHGKVEACAFEPVAAVVTFWARPAPEASDGVVAGHSLVARVGQIAFVHVGAGGAVASQTGGAGAAAVVRGTVNVEAFDILQKESEFGFSRVWPEMGV